MLKNKVISCDMILFELAFIYCLLVYDLFVPRIYGEPGYVFLSFFLSILSRSNFDHHLRCGGWLNFEFSKREKHSGWAIKTIYKKLCRGMLKHIPLSCLNVPKDFTLDS